MINPYYLITAPILLSALLYFFSYRKVRYIMLLVQSTLLFGSVWNYLYVRANGEQLVPLGNHNAMSHILLRCDTVSSVLVMLTALIFLALMVFNLPKEYVNNLFLFLFMVLECLIITIFFPMTCLTYMWYTKYRSSL